QVQYQCRIFPRDERRTRDGMVRELMKAVAHGMPQRLIFRDDDGAQWYGEGKTVGLPVDVTVGSPIYTDMVVTWRLNNPFLRLAQMQHDLLWGDRHPDGSPVLWGEVGLVWGQSS